MNYFRDRLAQPMLIGRDEPAFDASDYIYELKLDGDRCLAYLDDRETVLVNKRGRLVLPHLPELSQIHRQVGSRCILDGELIIGSGRKEEFELIRSRLTTSNPTRLARLSRELPATFVAFDILYTGQAPVIQMPLMERKAILDDLVTESDRLIISRQFTGSGIDFYNLVKEQGLEGVVAKQIDGRYLPGKRSTSWVKFKNWVESEFVIYGYEDKTQHTVGLFIGTFRNGSIKPEGTVLLGKSSPDFRIISNHPRLPGESIRLEPTLTCKVGYMCRTKNGALRQAFYRGLMRT